MGAAAAVAGIGAIGSIGSGIMGAGAAGKAASQESAAIQQGVDFQKQVYAQGSQNLQPWIGGGQSALTQLLGFYGLPGGNASGASQAFQQFQNTPFYQFPLQQGQLAVNRQLASSGLIGSGAALRDASQLNTGYASQGLQSYLSGLSGVAGSGQTAATSLLSGGNTAASTLGNLYNAQGQAQASGTIGANNALQNGIGNAIGGLLGAAQSTNLFGLGGTGSSSSYTGPSANALIGGQGSPSYIQGQLGLASNQYVP
jgi:hypothetical protein